MTNVRRNDIVAAYIFTLAVSLGASSVWEHVIIIRAQALCSKSCGSSACIVAIGSSVACMLLNPESDSMHGGQHHHCSISISDSQ